MNAPVSTVIEGRMTPGDAESVAEGVAGVGGRVVPDVTRRLRAGEEEAFRWLHRHWNERLFRYCFAVARGDGALAGEIAQATYLRVARHMRELPDEAALWNWLARAARSAATDLRRVGGRYRSALGRFAEWLREGEPTPEDGGAETALLRALDAALASLTDEQRLLIERRYFSRVPLEEIGSELGASARAVEGRLARLRAELRERIEHFLSTPSD